MGRAIWDFVQIIVSEFLTIVPTVERVEKVLSVCRLQLKLQENVSRKEVNSV